MRAQQNILFLGVRRFYLRAFITALLLCLQTLVWTRVSKMPSSLIPENLQFHGEQNRRAEFFQEQPDCSQQNHLRTAWRRIFGKLIIVINK